jgi:carbamoyl-phosphate synthase large subunit
VTDALLVLEDAAAGIPCVTTLPGAFEAVQGIEALLRNGEEPRSLQEYHARVRGKAAWRGA